MLLAVPLFLLSAELMNIGSMSDRLLRFCDALVGRFRGGLGHINIVQSVIFAGMSGSAIADLAGTGRVMINMMTKDGKYPVSYAAAITAASAVIGPIIPPSIPMVLYRARVRCLDRLPVPGRRHPRPADGAGADGRSTPSWRTRKNFPVEKPIPLREWPRITIEAFPALLMPVILLGGIYSGVMTPTEAAAVAAAYAFLISAFLYRSVTLRADLRRVPDQRPLDRLDRHADRRRAGVQLRHHDREHPADGAAASWQATS